MLTGGYHILLRCCAGYAWDADMEGLGNTDFHDVGGVNADEEKYCFCRLIVKRAARVAWWGKGVVLFSVSLKR